MASAVYYILAYTNFNIPLSIISYVAEMMANRVLRFFQKPTGVYHGSVFYQLSGGVGPSALACDSDGTLYVASYDVRGKHSIFCELLTIYIIDLRANRQQ